MVDRNWLLIFKSSSANAGAGLGGVLTGILGREAETNLGPPSRICASRLTTADLGGVLVGVLGRNMGGVLVGVLARLRVFLTCTLEFRRFVFLYSCNGLFSNCNCLPIEILFISSIIGPDLFLVWLLVICNSADTASKRGLRKDGRF